MDNHLRTPFRQAGSSLSPTLRDMGDQTPSGDLVKLILDHSAEGRVRRLLPMHALAAWLPKRPANTMIRITSPRGEIIENRTGDVVFIPANWKVSMAWSHVRRSKKLVAITFDQRRMEALLGAGCLTDIRLVPFGLSGGERSRWYHDISGLADELEVPAEGAERLVDAYVTSLLVHLGRWIVRRPAGQHVHQGGLGAHRLRTLLRLLDESVEGPKVQLSELASAMGVTTRHLTRAFKHDMGCTIGEYVRARKLHRAERLLQTTDIPLKRLAEGLGFSSAGSFSTFFCENRGLLPGEFRRAGR